MVRWRFWLHFFKHEMVESQREAATINTHAVGQVRRQGLQVERAYDELKRAIAKEADT